MPNQEFNTMISIVYNPLDNKIKLIYGPSFIKDILRMRPIFLNQSFFMKYKITYDENVREQIVDGTETIYYKNIYNDLYNRDKFIIFLTNNFKLKLDIKQFPNFVEDKYIYEQIYFVV